MKRFVSFFALFISLILTSNVAAIDIYNYDDNGIYIGSSSAGLDPLASIEAGHDVPLIPAKATITAPPAVIANQIQVFENGSWVIKPDYRGQVYHTNSNQKSVIIKTIGELPIGAILGEYQKTNEEILEDAKQFKYSELDADFLIRISEGVTCSVGGVDYFMASSLADVTLLEGGITLASKLFQATMTITDFNDNDHVISLADANAINLIQAINYATLRQRRNDLRTQVKVITIGSNANQAIASISAIVW